MKLSLFQGILLGVFGLGAIIGLIVFATYTSKGGNTGGIGTVVVWGTLPSAEMQSGLVEIAKSDQSLKGISYVQKDAATLKDDLASAIATGNAPDLVLATQEQIGELAAFTQPIPLSTLSANAFQGAFVGEDNLFAAPGGGWYALPFLIDPLVLFSNETILSSDGIARPPATWEALAGLVPNVAVLSPTRQITRGLIALGTYDNVHDARGILSALFLQTGVPISVRSSGGVPTADLGHANTGGNGLPPGQAVLRFYTQFADPSKVSYTWNASLPDSQSAFLSGTLGLYLGYASEAQFLSAANPNLSFNVTPLPQPATATGKSTYGLAYAFFIPRGAKNSGGAYQAAVLFSNTAEQQVFSAATGLAPAARSALSSPPASNPAAAVSYASALYAEGWLSPAPATTDTIFSGMITNVITGRSTLQTALSTAEQLLSAQLQ